MKGLHHAVVEQALMLANWIGTAYFLPLELRRWGRREQLLRKLEAELAARERPDVR